MKTKKKIITLIQMKNIDCLIRGKRYHVMGNDAQRDGKRYTQMGNNSKLKRKNKLLREHLDYKSKTVQSMNQNKTKTKQKQRITQMMHP